jgi:septin family protein
MLRSRYVLFVSLVQQITDTTQSMIPFAVVGSEKTIVVGGKQVRGRQNRWGVVNGMLFGEHYLLHPC